MCHYTLSDTTSSATAINTIQVEAKGGTVTNLKGYTYYYNGVDRGDSTTYKINHNDPERIAPDGTRIKIVEVMVKFLLALQCPLTGLVVS